MQTQTRIALAALAALCLGATQAAAHSDHAHPQPVAAKAPADPHAHHGHGAAAAPAAAHDEHDEHAHHGAAAAPADPHAQHKAAAGASADKPGAVKVRGLDATLVDQHGRQVHLRRDVIGDKIVVVDFVYTTCTTVCPLASAMLADLQKRLGAEAAREVELVTVTVDPVRDTPQVLKSYAARYQAGKTGLAGWTWLTGPTVAVNDVLKGLGAYSPNFTEHPLMVLVGDGASDTWTRFSGTPDPVRLAEHVNALRQARAGKLQARAGQ